MYHSVYYINKNQPFHKPKPSLFKIPVKTGSSTKYSKKINTNNKNVRYLVQNIKDKIKLMVKI